MRETCSPEDADVFKALAISTKERGRKMTIIRYSDRKLYLSRLSARADMKVGYITTQLLLDMIHQDQWFQIVDAVTKKDITNDIVIRAYVGRRDYVGLTQYLTSYMFKTENYSDYKRMTPYDQTPAERKQLEDLKNWINKNGVKP